MEPGKSNGVAIVTGAASGIGYSVAHALGSAGHSVAIVDINGDGAASAAETIGRETGATTCWQSVDVADREACSGAYRQILETLGKPGILVNNAGIMVRRKGRLEDIPPEDLDEMIAIHVGGTLNWSRLVIPDMRQAGFGRIINLSSCNAVTAVPYRIGYVTAKKAIRGVTEALALETARAGITVNAVAPGYILTDELKRRSEAGFLDFDSIAERTPVGRWGHPEEIADTISFLASENAAYITGATLVIDGGFTIRADPGEDLATFAE